mmetsp:Transcript_45505/g.87477  ORF Transcript_45505/g.87477 Transcript_45505/m.87477 type:complete len:536 (+) Transcript_45505:71-1678(+)
MSKAAIAGEEAKQSPGVIPVGTRVLQIHDDDEVASASARSGSCEWQYDALGAGKALAAVASADRSGTPMGSMVGQGAGFRAKDIESMLHLRARWMEQLGASALLRSEDLSDQSSDWEGGSDGDDDDGDGARVPSTAEKGPAEGSAAGMVSTSPEGAIVDNPLDFNGARARFVEAVNSRALPAIPENGATSAKLEMRRLEAPALRLRRIRSEVAALCSWAEAPGRVSGNALNGLPPASQEATYLLQEVRSLTSTMQQAATASASSGKMTAQQQVWLPPADKTDVATVRQLLEFAQVIPGTHEQSRDVVTDQVTTRPSYYLQAQAGATNGIGLQAAAEAERLQSLSARIQRISKALGKRDSPEAGSLADAALQLDRRLGLLQEACEGPDCERLSAGLRLLTASIDVAISEAQRLEHAHAEENANDPLAMEVSLDANPAHQAARIYAQVAGLEAVAARASTVERRLVEQEPRLTELGRFASDLSGAEEQARQARVALEATASAVEQMKKAVFSSREQLQRNVKALEAKVAVLQQDSAT